MPMSTSDAETELGDGDSPLSPCLLTLPIGGQQRTRKDATGAPTVPNTTSLQSPRRELRLSPASQLDVLSQISELADVHSRQSVASSAAATSTLSKRPAPHVHVWALPSSRGKRPVESLSNTENVTKSKAKKQKKTSQSQAERLAADMADWDSCSEGELFATEGLVDEWVFEDISDSDFES